MRKQVLWSVAGALVATAVLILWRGLFPQHPGEAFFQLCYAAAQGVVVRLEPDCRFRLHQPGRQRARRHGLSIAPENDRRLRFTGFRRIPARAKGSRIPLDRHSAHNKTPLFIWHELNWVRRPLDQ